MTKLLRFGAQQALAPDAATRRQDRGNFGSQKRSNVIPFYQGGAGEAQALGPEAFLSHQE